MSKTYDLRRLASRAKNIQIRCNDLADAIDDIKQAGAGELRAAGKRAEDVFKYLMARADDTRDNRGAPRRSASQENT